MASAQKSTDQFLEDPGSLQKASARLCIPFCIRATFLYISLPCTTAPQYSNGAVAASVAVCRKGICMICPKLCTPGAQVPAPSLFSDATKSLSIVVPAFNEEQRIAPMLDEALG